MGGLKEQILGTLSRRPGLTDRQLADELLGTDARQQSVNQACRALAKQRRICRSKGPDGLIRNHLGEAPPEGDCPRERGDPLSEDAIKQALAYWLESAGWRVVAIAWGASTGVDIEAARGAERWRIEVKGWRPRYQVRRNYFFAVLGEVLQRMEDPDARHSVALPALAEFRERWEGLPGLAKTRTGLTCLFVDSEGRVEEVL